MVYDISGHLEFRASFVEPGNLNGIVRRCFKRTCMTHWIAHSVCKMYAGRTESNTSECGGQKHLTFSITVVLVFSNSGQIVDSLPKSPHRKYVGDWVRALICWAELGISWAR